MANSINSSYSPEFYTRSPKRQRTTSVPVPDRRDPLRKEAVHTRLNRAVEPTLPPPQSNFSFLRFFVPVVLEQVRTIKEWMQGRILDIRMITAINEKIETIYSEESYDTSRKLAELGLLYYYLVQDEVVPDETSLLEKWIAEITQRVKDLQRDHKRLCPSDLVDHLPSGSISYLMHALTWVVFTPDGKFNNGGCYAVKAILNSPVNLFMSEDRRTQILTIIDKLIDDASFRNKFMQPFEVHEDLHELIRIDLKLPIDREIVFLYVRRDLLMALFSIIGQLNKEGNCHAVAMLSNLLGRYPDVLLDLLIEALQKASFNFYGEEIPILPLLESRRHYEKDFKARLPKKSALQLTGFLLAQQSLPRISHQHSPQFGQTMCSNVEEPSNGCMQVTLNKMDLNTDGQSDMAHEEVPSLDSIMEALFGRQTRYAKEVFLSLKHNLLQQMLLSILQFIPINSPDIGKRENWKVFSCKRFLFNKFYHFVILKFAKVTNTDADSGFKPFISQFRRKYRQRLFFLDYRSRSQKFASGRITNDYHSQGLIATDGDLSNYQPLMEIRRLCFLEDGVFHPIDRISDLISHLCQFIDEICLENDQQSMSDWVESLKIYLKSDTVAQEVAKIVQKTNGDEVNFSWQRYYDSNSFLILQRGGNPKLTILWNCLNRHFAPSSSFSSKNVKNFFTQLCDQIRAFRERKPDFFTCRDPQILTMTSCHAFNLSPLHFELFWSAGEPAVKLEKYVVEPAKALYRKNLPDALKKRILLEACGKEHAEFVCSQIPKRNMNAACFRREVLYVIDENYTHRFDIELNRALTEVRFEDFRQKLPQIADQLEIQLSKSQGRAIIGHVNPSRRKEITFSTDKLAMLLHQALVKNGHPFFPHYKIESVLCSQFSLPQIIDLGNLNWIGELKEYLIYSRLVIKYDLAKKRLIFSSRNMEVATSASFTDTFIQEIMAGIDLYFET